MKAAKGPRTLVPLGIEVLQAGSRKFSYNWYRASVRIWDTVAG